MYKNIESMAEHLTRAIAFTENGGKVDIDNPVAGKTGEMKSIFQFTPDTWDNYSKKVFGKKMPLNKDNETYVVYQKVKGWLEKGYTPKQIASSWNAGPGEPDAYTGKFSNGKPSIGINKKYGVKYDVPGYANKVDKYYKDFMAKSTLQQPAPMDMAKTTKSNLLPTKEATTTENPLQNVLNLMKSAKQLEPKNTPQKGVNTGIIQQLIS